RSRLQHQSGQARGGAEELRGFAASKVEGKYVSRRRSLRVVRGAAQAVWPGKGPSIHEKPSQAGFANGSRPDRPEPAAGGRRTTFGYRAVGSYRLGIENQRGAP